MRTHPTLAVLWVLADRREEEACVFDLLPVAFLSATALVGRYLWPSGSDSRFNWQWVLPSQGWYPISIGIQTNITKALCSGVHDDTRCSACCDLLGV